MSFYDEMATIANDALFEFGQSITITHNTQGAYNPSTGSATVTTSTESAVGAVFEWGLSTIRYGQGYDTASLIKSGDKQLLLSAIGITPPQLNDIVTVGSINYTLVPPLKPLSPSGTVVLYECNIRWDA